MIQGILVFFQCVYTDIFYGGHPMTDWKYNRIKFLIIAILICGGGLLFLTSCASLGTERIYRSEEYVVGKFQKNETPDTLAEKFLGDREKSWVIEDANEDVSLKKNKIIIIPLKEKNKAGLTADGFQVVPILCYHRFSKDCESPLCLPVDLFKQQMRYLSENGYRVITFGQLIDFLEYREALPQKAVIISIDDGYRSTYDIAYPILKKYGFNATLFIYTDFIGASRNALTWRQINRMKADGFEIGSHTLSHIDLTRQKEGEDTQTYMGRIEKELRESKQIIDKELGQNTILLAFPFGRYNPSVLEISKRLGYQVAVTVTRGGNPFFANPLTLKRTQVLKKDMTFFTSVLKSVHKLSLK
jgi:peptidoglycan/xylan/chitin deacetylase (PgdA/CDA1 family)